MYGMLARIDRSETKEYLCRGVAVAPEVLCCDYPVGRDASARNSTDGMHCGYRDNLDTLLANAIATDRKLEKSFRMWLEQCHRELDKTCMYQELMSAQDQLRLRKLFGHSRTFFKRVTDGSRTIEVRAVWAF